MELTREIVESKAAEYADEEPLYTVEREQVETLPDAIRTGEYGWRDVEWVVQWYFRRYLGAYPDVERRAAEDAFGENDYEAVRDALESGIDAETTRERLDALTTLVGVDVRIASAFLQFSDPSRYVAIGEREWLALVDTGELTTPYPHAPETEDYLTFDDACRAVTDRLDVDAWTLYRALWRLSSE